VTSFSLWMLAGGYLAVLVGVWLLTRIRRSRRLPARHPYREQPVRGTVVHPAVRIQMLSAAAPPQAGGQYRAGRPIPPRTLAGRPIPYSRLESAAPGSAPRRAGWPPPAVRGAAAATPQAPARGRSHNSGAHVARPDHGRDPQTQVLTRIGEQQTETWTRPAGLAARR